MIYFFKYTRVQIILITWATLLPNPAKANTVRPESNILSKFVRSLVKPYIHSLFINASIEGFTNRPSASVNSTKEHNFFTSETNTFNRVNTGTSESNNPALVQEVSKVPMLYFIQNKINTLQPYLDDNTASELDGLRLEGADETTIIEFVPNIVSKSKRTKGDRTDHQETEKVLEFQSKIYKYKRMRNKIRLALNNEKISDDTKHMVTRTMDKMITHMKEHKCKWADDSVVGRTRNSGGRSPPEKLVQKWNLLWKTLKQNFSQSGLSMADPHSANEQQKFLAKFQELVSMMTDELNHLVSKYKIICRFQDLHNKEDPKKLDRGIFDKKTARISAMNSDKHIRKVYSENQLCDHFQVCSEELTDYVYKFYINLNDSAVSVVDNYALMFLRDVSDDGYNEKERIVDMMRRTCKIIDRKVDLLFRNEIMKLELDDKKNKYENMRILYKFLQNAVTDAKKQILEEVTSGLKSVRYKVIDTIKRDIQVNLNSEMAILEKTFNDRMCPTFEVCNGRIYKTRNVNKLLGRRVNVFVKLQHGPDEAQPSADKTTKTSLKNIKVFRTKSPKVNATRTAPSLARLEARTEPETTTIKVTTKINKNEKGNDDEDNSDIDKSEKVNAGPQNQRKSETHRSFFNAHAQKIVNDIKSNFIGKGSHEGELSDPDQATLNENDPLTGTHDEMTDTTKGQSLEDRDNKIEVTIKSEQLENAEDKIKQTRRKMAGGIDKTQRSLVIYR